MQLSPELAGLTDSEVHSRISDGLSNSQKFESSRSIKTIVRANVFTLFNGVVGGAFLVLLILGQFSDALFGLAVITNIAIGIAQEYRSKKILDRLAILNQAPVQIRRAGQSILVNVEEVVIDDLLELRTGDQLVADAIVISADALEIDESLLTGESDPQSRSSGDQLLSGSGVVGGRALARVNRVGSETYASKLLVDARKFSTVSSEIRQSLARLIRWISYALGPLMLLVLISQLWSTDNWLEAVVRSVASTISFVPQGLVLITSIAFAIAAIRLARKRVLLQELAAVEILARVDVVCFDKTGTLTDGSMRFSFSKELLDPKSLKRLTSTKWQDIVGEFAYQEDANATMRALRETFERANLVVTGGEAFDSKRKWSSLEISGEQWKIGAAEMLTENQTVLKTASEFAAQGNRTLLLVHESETVTPVALICISERIRTEASDSLAYFAKQGVSVRVISGDHPLTVAAVAHSAGLKFEGAGFDARNLPEDEKQLELLMQNQLVFGRVTPQQKKQMVTAMQRQGHVVAMIGDGVNDALALKQANLGVAMGSAAPATRAVANLVLLDSHFEVFPSIVSEGRRVIANVERLSRLFLTKTVWAIALALGFSLLVWEFPFLPRQLSAVDGFAIGIPAFLLALLPNAQPYRPGFLRRALSFCVPAGLVTALATVALAAFNREQGGWTIAEGQTATSILLSVTGLWVLGSLVRPWTKAKFSILILMILAGIAVFTVEQSRNFFGFVNLSSGKLMITLILAAAAAVGIELVQIISRRTESRRRSQPRSTVE